MCERTAVCLSMWHLHRQAEPHLHLKSAQMQTENVTQSRNEKCIMKCTGVNTHTLLNGDFVLLRLYFPLQSFVNENKNSVLDTSAMHMDKPGVKVKLVNLYGALI